MVGSQGLEPSTRWVTPQVQRPTPGNRYLRPIADLHSQLEEKIYVFIQNSIHWDPEEPGDNEKQASSRVSPT